MAALLAFFFRLAFRVGSTEPSLSPVAQSAIRKTPGAYAESTTEGAATVVNYYIVPVTGAPYRTDKDTAEAFAKSQASDVELAAHDVALYEATRTANRADGFESSPLDSIELPTCADLLRKFGCDFRVVAKNAAYSESPVNDAKTYYDAPGFRMTVREDDGTVLHASTDAYQVVQSVDALNLLDRAARKGEILYRSAWQSLKSKRIRAVGAERGKNVDIHGQEVGIRFEIDGVRSSSFGGRVAAGGTLSTSHDGSSAIKATACLHFSGVTIFATDVKSWRHTSMVGDRLEESKEALDYLIRAARGLVRDAEATVNVPDDEAADVVLRAVAPELFAVVKPSLDPKDTAAAVKVQAAKLVAARLRLHAAAQVWTNREKDCYLGGFRYVLAAPSFASNRVITTASYFDGLARERMTAALLALARHAGCLEAGMVPDAVAAA